MINWEYFKQKVLEFSNNQENILTFEQTAKYYSDLYVEVLSGATLLMGNTFVYNSAAYSLLYNGWLSFFNINQKLPIPITPIQILPLATSFVSFWKVQGFNNTPPHPPTISPAPEGVTILFPGNPIFSPVDPTSLSSLLFTAFTSTNKLSYVNLLATALQVHVSTISGLYTGIVTTPGGPVVTPVPWIGVF